MIILQAEFIGDNSHGSIPFENSCRYNLRLEVCGSAFSTDDSYHHIGPVRIQTNSGKFPDYTRKQFDYQRLESFIQDWKISKINLFKPDLPKFDLIKVRTLLYASMRDHKLNQLV